MPALSEAALLDVWERGRTRSPVHRALMLLSLACPEMPLEALAGLSIGQRDACLLDVREQVCGPRVQSLAACPACGEQLELAFDVADIRALPERETAPGTPLVQVEGEYEVSFRLPNSLDLIAANESQDAAAARRVLLDRCLLKAERRGKAAPLGELPQEVLAAVVTGMAQADPQAEIALALSCPACAHEWTAPFDVLSFFWQEIDAWAYRALYQVHVLASAYGWSEADILAMSAWKRQFYLQMVGR